jgi:hypothetical protein
MKKQIYFAGLMLLAGASLAQPETALNLRIHLAEWVNSHAETSNKTSSAVTDLGIVELTQAVMTENGEAFVAARIETSFPDAESAWLSQTNLVQLTPVADHAFKWIPKEAERGMKIPAFDDLRVHFSGSSVLICEPSRLPFASAMNAAPMGPSLLQAEANLTLLLKPFCDFADRLIEEQEDGFGKAMIGGMWKSLRAQIEAMDDAPTTHIHIVSAKENIRTMDLRLAYKNAETANQMSAFFEQKDAWKNPDISERQLALSGLIETPHFQGRQVTGSELGLTYEWAPAEDAEMMKIIGKALFGGASIMRNSDDFPINPKQTIAAPNLSNNTDFDLAQLEQELRAALFFKNGWSNSLDFEIDYLALPNSDFLTATLTNLGVQTENGENIIDPKRGGRFSVDSAKQSGRISLSILKDQEKPTAASFTLNLEVPTAIEKCTLTPEMPLFESAPGAGCVLVVMSNSVVSLRSKNFSLRDAKIYARDADGDYLDRSGSSWSDSKYRATCKGIPASVEVVLPTKTETLSLDFNNLPVGDDAKLEMPSNPTNSIITRYTLEAAETFCDPDLIAVAAGEVAYVTNGGWQKNQHEIHFPKPENVEVESASLKTYLAGTDQWLSAGQRGYSYSNNHFSWNLDNTNALQSASAIFGEISAEFWSGTGSYRADNLSTNFTPLIPGQELPAVSVEHNVVWIKAEPDGEILGIQAFDATGRRLKKDHRTSWNNSKKGYFFWGQPTRAVVAYAAKKVSITVPFNVEIKTGGLADIDAVQPKVVAIKEVIDVLKETEKNNNNLYGTLLAANYYALGHQHKPKAAIPLEVAQSDPNGASVFGYEAKPYKGYHFKRILTENDSKQEMPEETCDWEGGSFQTKRYSGILLAIPAEKGNPTLMIQWQNVYAHFGDFSDVTVLNDDSRELEKNGWIKIR